MLDKLGPSLTALIIAALIFATGYAAVVFASRRAAENAPSPQPGIHLTVTYAFYSDAASNS